MRGPAQKKTEHDTDFVKPFKVSKLWRQFRPMTHHNLDTDISGLLYFLFKTELAMPISRILENMTFKMTNFIGKCQKTLYINISDI